MLFRWRSSGSCNFIWTNTSYWAWGIENLRSTRGDEIFVTFFIAGVMKYSILWILNIMKQHGQQKWALCLKVEDNADCLHLKTNYHMFSWWIKHGWIKHGCAYLYQYRACYGYPEFTSEYRVYGLMNRSCIKYSSRLNGHLWLYFDVLCFQHLTKYCVNGILSSNCIRYNINWHILTK